MTEAKSRQMAKIHRHVVKIVEYPDRVLIYTKEDNILFFLMLKSGCIWRVKRKGGFERKLMERNTNLTVDQICVKIARGEYE